MPETHLTDVRSESHTIHAGLHRALRDMLYLLGLTFLLWVYHVYARTLPGPALAAAWLLMTLLIGSGLFWRARIRRRAFIAAYLAPGSGLAHRLRGGVLLAARHGLLAGLLAAFLTVAIVRVPDARVWLLLAANVPVLVFVQLALRRALASHVNLRYLPELSWRLALLVTGAALFAAVLALALYRDYPDLGSVSMERAVWHLVDQERARSDTALLLLQLSAAKDGLRLWLAQQLMPVPGTSVLQLLGWLIILMEEALFVWSWLLACAGLLIGVNRNDRTVE